MKKRQVHLLFVLLILSIITLLIISCSPSEEEINQAKDEEKEAQYSQAIIKLTEDNSTDNPGLDKRYNYLKKQINKIIEGEEELKIATFTRIKIELDYLKMKNHSKVTLLTNDFMTAYAEAEKLAEEKDWGSSLSDRQYSLDREIESLSTSETELTVTEYLQIEKGINKLEKDGYPLPTKITELKNKLFKLVLAELESAIVDYEVPEITEEEIKEVKKAKETKEVKEEIEEEIKDVYVPTIPSEEPTGPRTRTIYLETGGFSKESINISVGDTINWKNVRTEKYKIALVLGNGQCRFVKSKIFKTGESYNATFNEPLICWVSDGIFTTQAMKITVS